MEKHKRSCGRQGRKKVEPNMRNNAGCIEGVVLLGGALAIASLVAAFTIKKSNRNHTQNINSTTIDSCRKEDNGSTEGLRSVLHDSSSTLHQISCCTKHETSEIVVNQIETCELVSAQSLISSEGNIMHSERDIMIHDTEQESTAKTGDVEEKNSIEPNSVMETIEIDIEGEAADKDADADQPFEEMSTLQSSLSSIAEEKSSSSTTGEDDEEEYSLMRWEFSTEEEDDDDDEEEEEYSPIQSAFSTEEEDEEYSPMRSLFSEEEDSPIRSSFSTEEDEEVEEEEESPLQSLFSEEEDSPIQSSFSTEEDEEVEEEESPLQSPFSTEENESSGESVTEMEEEESSEGTWSSSTESNYMKAMSPESKEIINISHQTANREDYLATAAFDKSGNKDGKRKKETQELGLINGQKQHHSAKPQIWVRLGLVLLLLLLLFANIRLLPLNLSI